MAERDRMTEVVASGNRPARRLLGQVLVDGDFISAGELERALEEQNRTNELLGEVLVRMGAVDPGEIAAVVAIQCDLASLEDAVKAAAGVRRCLGEMLLAARKVTPEQLGDALEEQRRTGERLGQILVRRGALTERQLDVALAFQRAQGGEAPTSVRLRLGEILVATGQITREQLDAVLAHQKLAKKNIGDLLVESGAARPEQIRHGLKLQEKLVTAAIVAALSLAEAAWAQETPRERETGGHGSAQVLVTARVLPRVSLKVLHQSKVLDVTTEDISRGYVDAPGASRIEVRENSPAGCLLVFEGTGVNGFAFSRVTVLGLGRDIEIGPGGGFVPHPHTAAPVSADLTYRFFLGKDTRPGTYPWPLSLSIRLL